MKNSIELSEHQEQVAIFNYFRMLPKRYPETKLMGSSIAGVKLSVGTWRKLKRAGYKTGTADITLPVARSGFHSLHIELKKKGGRPSPEQIAWLERLDQENNLACAVWGHKNAINLIEDYLNGKITHERGVRYIK